MDDFITGREVCLRLKNDGLANFTTAYLTQLKKDGTVPYHILPGKRRAYYKYEEVKNALGLTKTEAEELRETLEELGESVDFSQMTLNEVKIAKEYYQGKLAELDYRKKSGELLTREDVEREASDVALRVKNALLSLPHKLSVRLVGVESPNEMEEILEVEIRQILEELSGANE